MHGRSSDIEFVTTSSLELALRRQTEAIIQFEALEAVAQCFATAVVKAAVVATLS